MQQNTQQHRKATQRIEHKISNCTARFKRFQGFTQVNRAPGREPLLAMSRSGITAVFEMFANQLSNEWPFPANIIDVKRNLQRLIRVDVELLHVFVKVSSHCTQCGVSKSVLHIGVSPILKQYLDDVRIAKETGVMK